MIMQRKLLRKKEIKEFNEKIKQLYGKEDFIDKKAKVELVDKDNIYINNELAFFYREDILIPSLKTLLKENILKKITVDMGAIKFVTNGADIMRPGITEIEDDIQEGDHIAIIDETHKKPLAIGKALQDTNTMRTANTGKSVKNIHFIGDELWNSN